MCFKMTNGVIHNGLLWISAEENRIHFAPFCGRENCVSIWPGRQWTINSPIKEPTPSAPSLLIPGCG
jgi:hypothetical protein